MPARTQSRPAAGEGLVFIAEPEALAALREADGSEAWRLPLTERLAAPLVWDNGWLIAATASGTLLALRGLDGDLVWRRDLGSPLSAPPALAADRVYAPAKDGRIIALRVDTGEPLWERRLGGAPSEMLALDDRLYVGSDDNFFYCLDGRTRPNRLALAHGRRRRRSGRRGRAPRLFRVVRQHLARAGSPERGPAMEATVAVSASHGRADGRARRSS